jgi:thymidylate kinase
MASALGPGRARGAGRDRRESRRLVFSVILAVVLERRKTKEEEEEKRKTKRKSQERCVAEYLELITEYAIAGGRLTGSIHEQIYTTTTAILVIKGDTGRE